jgi:hypothetical protein
MFEYITGRIYYLIDGTYLRLHFGIEYACGSHPLEYKVSKQADSFEFLSPLSYNLKPSVLEVEVI